MPTTDQGRTIGGRYQILDTLGSGGTGTVYRARDLIGGASVAVKELNPLTASARMRHRREVLALRVLQAPGVVKLVDDGVSDGKPFIVMELLGGTPFPGTGRRTWDEIAPVTIALLETLARIHAIGIIHRDLKPANVLVDENGRPTLLDFGLARGDLIVDLNTTGPDTIVGTPRFQSPEQLTNNTLDSRTDLYSVGVMLWEALAPGRYPHPIDSYAALVTTRVWRDAPPLQFAAPDTPDGVCNLIDRLLARLPEGRPRTANEALQDIKDLTTEVKREPFPRLGGDAIIRRVMDTVHLMRSVDLAGGPGSGRTRCLLEVADGLARSGRRSAWTRPGSRPFESISSVVGLPESLVDEPEPNLLAVESSVARQLRETLLGGTVLLVDNAEELDHWSASMMERLKDDGAIVRTWREGPRDSIVLPALEERDLFDLFHGPDQLLHLREDGARALFERTGGTPGRLVQEVGAWVDNGLATWRDRRLVLDRTALDRLEGGVAVQVPATPSAIGAHLKRGLEQMLAWITLIWPHSTPVMLRKVLDRTPWEIDLMVTELERVSAVRRMPDGRVQPRLAAVALQEWSEKERREAHAAAAGLLPAGASGRFAHMVGAGDFAAAAAEGLYVANQMVDQGYLGRALGVLGHALQAAREAENSDLERQLLLVGVKAALAENSAQPIAYIRYELQRARRATDVSDLTALLVAAADSFEQNWETRRRNLEALPAFHDITLEAWRGSLRMALSVLDASVAVQVLSEYATLAQATKSSFLLGKVLGWEGLVLYRQGRYVDAAKQQLAALPLKEGTADRLSTLLNAAAAWLDGGELTEAERCAEEAATLARDARLPVFEARAVGTLRAVLYRRAVPITPDLEYVEALSLINAPQFGTLALCTEAAVAWRSNQLELATDLAARARTGAEIAANRAAKAVAQALYLTSSACTDPDLWTPVLEQVREVPSAAARTETLALAARLIPLAPDSQALLESSFAAWASDPRSSIRGAVLAPIEVAAYISGTLGP